MILPDDNLRMAREGPLRSASGSRLRLWLSAAAVLLAGAVLWALWVDGRIQAYAHRDQARKADAIAVFGAAEYDGRPSPVLRARLAHGLELYQRGLAPMIITLGGSDPADLHSEGGVGHDYLIAHGVPENAIIAETRSDDTEESAERLAVIARKNGFRSIDVVSDGSHLFRIHAICARDGLEVYTSPRPPGRSIPGPRRVQRMAHEIASYTAWRLHMH
ncbi:MAG TPA: YdcF family protein [Acidobacteriaceae bacterium]